MNSNLCTTRRDSARHVEKYKTSGKQCMTYDCYKYNTNPFRTRETVVDNNYVSLNNKLVGGQNPKTLIPPVITTPCYSIAWKASDLVVPSRINDRTADDLYRSGYLSKDTDTSTSSKMFEYQNTFRSVPENKVSSISVSSRTSPVVVEDLLNATKMTEERLGDVKENFEQTLPSYDDATWQNKINMANGYVPEQFGKSKFPSNSPRGRIDQNPDLAEYNKNIFTQTVQPGVYYKEDVVEPVNSNIGISFQQEFLPRKTSRLANGDVLVEDMDPNLAEESIPTYDADNDTPSINNVYDPRFNGYGSASRFYIHNVTGQPRFPYDDINAVTMPNYVTRSKIDTQTFGDRYGTMQNAGKGLNEIRDLANAAFINDTETHRNSIMVDAMRKINAAMWQRRAAPLLGVSRR
jgi:hypothetical protein